MKAVSRLLILASLILPLGAFAAGAIAVDDDEGDSEPGYGISVGASSRDAAAKDAMADCRKAGNKGCRVVVRFDKCGAYASSKKYSGVGFGSTLAVAQKKALEECGSGSCKVHVAECE